MDGTGTRQESAPGVPEGRPPYVRDAVAVVAALRSDPELGLSSGEARSRLSRFGANELTS